MQCNYCQRQFNQSANIPRLLIFCGHSLCEMCCCKLHTNNRIQCPECASNTFIQQISYLPKNLALLKVNDFQRRSPIQNLSCCPKHDKKYEAFCEKQKQLLCIDCILLDGHRNHDMESIKNAHNKHLGLLEKRIRTFEQTLEKIKEEESKNFNNENQTIKSYKECKQSIQDSFDELKQIVQQEQRKIINRISEQYEQALKNFQENKIKYSAKIIDLTQCLETIKASYLSMGEMMFLESLPTRTAMIDSLNVEHQEALKIVTFTHSKNMIGDCMIKNIEKSFKTQVNTQPNVQVSLHKKGESLGNVKNFKKSSAGNIPTYKNIQKKPTKKQSQNSMPQGVAYSPVNPQPNTSLSNNSNIRPTQSQNKNRNALHNAQSKSNSQEKKNIGKGKSTEKQQLKNKCCDLSMVEPKQSLFNSFLSNMTSFLNDKKCVYVMGGFDPENSSVLKLDLATLVWEQITKMNTPRSKFGCIVNNETKSILMLGGKKGKERISDSQIFIQGNWMAGFDLRKKRSGFGIISLDGNVYVIGGNDGDSILNTVEVLNLTTGEWKNKQSMFEARDELAVSLGPDNKIYAIGGFGGRNNQPLKSAEVYDPKLDQWTQLPSLKTARRALAAASLADGIYAIGGFDGEKYLSSVEKYQQGHKQWIKVASLQKARCTHSAVTIFDSQQILVFGGFDEIALDSVERYSLVSNEWQFMPEMPGPRFMHSSVVMTQ